MSYGTCFVCGKEVKELDDKVIFGLDGDFVHKSCEPSIQKKKSMINNASNGEFAGWLLGGKLKEE